LAGADFAAAMLVAAVLVPRFGWVVIGCTFPGAPVLTRNIPHRRSPAARGA